jgi:hypothetical protein
MIGGEKLVLHGAVPFRDVMDTKPLLMMYTYGFASWVFGHHLYSIRLLDYLFHIGALYYFYRILRRMMHKESYALASIFIYAILYTAIDYPWTAQAESFIFLYVIFLIDITDRMVRTPAKKENIFFNSLLCGAVAFVILCYKFSLLAAPFSLGIWLFYASERKKRDVITFTSLSLISFLGLCTLLVILLSQTGSLSFMKENLSWLAEYGRISDLFHPMVIARTIVSDFTDGLITLMTLSGLVLTAIGIYISLPQKNESNGGKFWKDQKTPVMFVFAASVLTISLLFEGKNLEYQYIRILWTIVPFIAIGCFRLSTTLKRIWTKSQGNRLLKISMRIACIGLALFFLFFSPVYLLSDRSLYRLSRYQAGSYSDGIIVEDDILAREKAMYLLAKRIEPKLQPRDEIFVFGEHPALYFHLHRTPPTMLLSDAFITASWSPQRWKEKVLREFKQASPRFVFIEKNDVMPIINESADDSWHYFQEWTPFHDFVTSNYTLVDTLSHFMAFERNK